MKKHSILFGSLLCATALCGVVQASDSDRSGDERRFSRGASAGHDLEADPAAQPSTPEAEVTLEFFRRKSEGRSAPLSRPMPKTSRARAIS